VVSEVVGMTAGVSVGAFPGHRVQVRGLSAPLAIRAIDSAAMLAAYESSDPDNEALLPIT
ncbi:MAG: hypothetical protein WB697_13585, partial [Stellaceae bacterium]